MRNLDNGWNEFVQQMSLLKNENVKNKKTLNKHLIKLNKIVEDKKIAENKFFKELRKEVELELRKLQRLHK